jgi:sensor histidine kinase regulating citrate/malate metabolism|tara:strand:+ start:63 stop:329 length:267 start_codon:yes stop_codon:yes gene_type:complete
VQQQNLFLQKDIDRRWRAFVNYEFVNTLIEPERMDNLFNFGFSSTGARVRLTAGLPAAYNIMQRHGGEIRLDSDLGRGTRVRLELPAF